MEDPALLSFGLWIKRRRKALDLTQDALAALVGCSKDLIVKIEGDARRPSREIAALLATHLQLAPEERDDFIRCARAELTPDWLPPPARSVARAAFVPVPAASAPVPTEPSGMVLFLFTDIAGSTRLWEQQPDAMRAALARHDQILRQAIAEAGGQVFKTVGDAFHAAFRLPQQALQASLAVQRALQAEAWAALGLSEPIQVRMALHAGTAEWRDGDYFGPPLNRLARLLATGHGGQVLLSAAAQELLADQLLEDVALADLGVHRLKDLSRPEHVYQAQVPDLPWDFPPLQTLDARPSNLPIQPTPLIGRERELAQVTTLLARPDVRLVTLTGPGGTGKTRLGVQSAAELLDRCPDGAFFVDLAPITDPALVAATIAQTLGVTDAGTQPIRERLKSVLRTKDILLLLDNFEQVLDAAPLVAELLAAAAGLKVLVTSRAALHLSGEHEYAVPPLALPPTTDDQPFDTAQGRRPTTDDHAAVRADTIGQYAAVALFIARAQAAKADFAVTNATAPAVAEICVRLDGLPLAIELAAARIRMFPPEMLLARLQQATLPTLAGGARDLPARQQTIRSTIDWSYRLLTPSQQRLFVWLGVFVGGWTLEMAEAVCAEDGLDVVAELQALVEHSLVRVVETHGKARYTMLETIRTYALDRLLHSKEDEIARQRHAAYFVELAERIELPLKGPESLTIRAALLQELGNLRAVMVWSIDSDQHAVAGMRLLAALLDFFRNEGYIRYAASWSRVLQTRVNVTLPIRLRARVLWSDAYCLRILGERHRARTLYEASLGLFREIHDLSGCAEVLNHLAYMAHDDGDIPRALALQTESLALAQQGTDVWAMGWALLGLGQLACDSGDLIETQERYRASLRCFELIGHTWSIAVIRFFLADVLYHQGRLDVAMRAYQELLPLFATTETRGRYQPQTNSRLAQIAMAQGDLVAAETYATAALELWRERGRGGAAETLRLLGMIALRANMHQYAEQYFQQSLSEATHQQEMQDQLLAMRALGVIAGYHGNTSHAAQLLSEALRGFAAQGNTVYTCWVIEQCASVCATFGRPEYAARLWGAAAALLAKTTNPVWDSDYIDASAPREQVRATLTAEAFEAAWASGQALTLEQAVAEALGDRA